MKALAALPAPQGIAAMQRISVVVLNRVFLGVSMGTALLGAVCVPAAFFPWEAVRSMAFLAAGLLYVVGTFLVTIFCNVPGNQRLANLDPDGSEAAEYWPRYVDEWTNWNYVRTAAAIASSACGALALAA